MLRTAIVLGLMMAADTSSAAPQDSVKADRCRAVAAELASRAHHDRNSLLRREDHLALNGARDQISFKAMQDKAEADIKAAEAIRARYGDLRPSPQMAAQISGLTPFTLNLEAELCRPPQQTASNSY